MTKLLPILSPDDAEADAEADRDTLRHILDSGLILAQEITRQVSRPKAAEPADEVAVAYEKLGRTLRRSILLARSFDPGTDQARSRAELLFHRTVLQALRQAGRAILDGITAQATTPVPFVPGLPLTDAALALDRTARCLRRTMLLNRVLATRPVPRAPRPARPVQPAPSPTPPQPAPPQPASGPNPRIPAILAAHAAMARQDRPDSLDTPDRLEALDPVPDAAQVADLAASLPPPPRHLADVPAEPYSAEPHHAGPPGAGPSGTTPAPGAPPNTG